MQTYPVYMVVIIGLLIIVSKCQRGTFLGGKGLSPTQRSMLLLVVPLADGHVLK